MYHATYRSNERDEKNVCVIYKDVQLSQAMKFENLVVPITLMPMQKNHGETGEEGEHRSRSVRQKCRSFSVNHKINSCSVGSSNIG